MLAASVLVMTSFSLWRHSLLSWPRPALRTYVADTLPRLIHKDVYLLTFQRLIYLSSNQLPIVVAQILPSASGASMLGKKVRSTLTRVFFVWRVDRVTSSLVVPGAGDLACHRPWLKSSLLKMEATFGEFSERILRHSKTCDVWWRLTSKKKTLIYDRVWQPANDCRYLASIQVLADGMC